MDARQIDTNAALISKKIAREIYYKMGAYDAFYVEEGSKDKKHGRVWVTGMYSLDESSEKIVERFGILSKELKENETISRLKEIIESVILEK